MKGAFSRIVLAAVGASCLGCAMCQAPDDYAYSAYGGRVQREDMHHGRVGSILGPPGGYTVVPYEPQGPTPAAPVQSRPQESESPVDDLRDTLRGEFYGEET